MTSRPANQTITAKPTRDATLQDQDKEPFTLFREWFQQAKTKEPNDPNAMALATVDSNGLPNVRMVLLKDVTSDGVVFYTNSRSRKGAELGANMQAAAVLHWKTLRRQVRIRGPVEAVSDAETNVYFLSRPRASRIGAWASMQSQPLESRAVLEEAVGRETVRFGGLDVPRPPHWTGYRIRPIYLEFWTEMPFRLHNRLAYTRAEPEGPWSIGLLYP